MKTNPCVLFVFAIICACLSACAVHEAAPVVARINYGTPGASLKKDVQEGDAEAHKAVFLSELDPSDRNFVWSVQVWKIEARLRLLQRIRMDILQKNPVDPIENLNLSSEDVAYLRSKVDAEGLMTRWSQVKTEKAIWGLLRLRRAYESMVGVPSEEIENRVATAVKDPVFIAAANQDFQVVMGPILAAEKQADDQIARIRAKRQ